MKVEGTKLHDMNVRKLKTRFNESRDTENKLIIE